MSQSTENAAVRVVRPVFILQYETCRRYRLLFRTRPLDIARKAQRKVTVVVTGPEILVVVPGGQGRTKEDRQGHFSGDESHYVIYHLRSKSDGGRHDEYSGWSSRTRVAAKALMAVVSQRKCARQKDGMFVYRTCMQRIVRHAVSAADRCYAGTLRVHSSTLRTRWYSSKTQRATTHQVVSYHSGHKYKEL